MNGPADPYWRSDPRPEKCSYADKYQAKRAPTCNCYACEMKWYNAERKRATADAGNTGHGG